MAQQKMTWERKPALEDQLGSCVTCRPKIESKLPLIFDISVGFGDARLTRDGKTVWKDNNYDSPPLKVLHAEQIAVEDPDHDWRIVLDGPLHGETYQRHGPACWVMIERNEGFA